jgi:nocardicin N-oxygenase
MRCAGQELKVPSYPFGDRHALDLEEEYESLRRRGPLQRVAMPVGGVAWLVVGYDEVKQVLVDPRFSRSAANQPDVPRLSPEVLPRRSILALDPPEHTALRRSVAGDFTAGQVEHLRPRIADVASDLIDAMTTAQNWCDIISSYIEPLVMTIVLEWLDVSPGRAREIRSLVDSLAARDVPADELAKARHRFEALLTELPSSKGGADMISGEIDPGLKIALFAGGRGSTTTFLSSAVLALLREPELYHQLVDRPERIPAAVEELLRFVPVGVGGGFTRVAVTDLTLGSTAIRAGDAVVPAMPAANRDPAVFDEPDRVDFGRRGRPHLGFGRGPHYCIGAGLARALSQVGLAMLCSRLPGLRLWNSSSPLDWRRGRNVRSLITLEVTW